jgi:hypothetical protein
MVELSIGSVYYTVEKMWCFTIDEVDDLNRGQLFPENSIFLFLGLEKLVHKHYPLDLEPYHKFLYKTKIVYCEQSDEFIKLYVKLII